MLLELTDGDATECTAEISGSPIGSGTTTSRQSHGLRDLFLTLDGGAHAFGTHDLEAGLQEVAQDGPQAGTQGLVAAGLQGARHFAAQGAGVLQGTERCDEECRRDLG